MIHFSVKNFERFQHYKDRNPPWIKLYNELLDDYAFSCLQDASKWHLIAIWLLASRSENKIPFDPAWVQRRINASEPVDLQVLVDAGFLLLDQEVRSVEQSASAPLAKCLSRERGETEAEREAETEVRADARDAEFGFLGAVVRLKIKDFGQWESAYSNLDLKAELVARDAWLASEASDEDRRKWFITTSKYLANRNAEAKARGGGGKSPVDYHREIMRGAL